MDLILTLYSAMLFFALIPGVLIKLPPNGNFFTVATIHTLVFGFIFFFTHEIVEELSINTTKEGYIGTPWCPDGFYYSSYARGLGRGGCVRKTAQQIGYDKYMAQYGANPFTAAQIGNSRR